MSRDRTYDESLKVRLTTRQMETVEMLADVMECSNSEVVRRMIFATEVLWSDDVALADALKPIPEIVDEVTDDEATL